MLHMLLTVFVLCVLPELLIFGMLIRAERD